MVQVSCTMASRVYVICTLRAVFMYSWERATITYTLSTYP